MGDFLATGTQIQSFWVLVFEDVIGKNTSGQYAYDSVCRDLDTT